eukprot:TRINITY_DN12511_c0_g1_i1.p1 TRINITY_DN12511_c0_g1~~TRINITY_DN12511_c0_g1_i1.p1  ORF type:complete len:177 (-),score=42.08 TRINITY_DN12511_c0_g1_i1:128-658(-)
MCQQFSNAIEGRFPIYKQGIFYYVDCFKSSTRVRLNEQRYLVTQAIKGSYDLIRNNTGNSDQDLDIEQIKQVAAASGNADVQKAGQIFDSLQKVIKTIDDLDQCVFIRRYAVYTEDEICYTAYEFFPLAIIGMTLLGIGILSLAAGMISQKDVIEIRLESYEKMQHRRLNKNLRFL